MGRKGEHNQNRSLCWKCVNAVPDNNGHGCSWSRGLEPVEGWMALPSRKKHTTNMNTKDKKYTYVIEGWYVIECPEYKRG